MQARVTTDVLAKQAALHVVAMLKGEVVNQFIADQVASTTSSVSFAMVLSSTHEQPPHPVAPSWLGVPTSPSPEMHSMAAGGACPPFIDLNRTLVLGESSSWHNKAPQARAVEDLPKASDLFGQMAMQPMVDEVLPWSSSFVRLHLSSHHHCPMQDDTHDDTHDCTMIGVET
jgi:hypothetical protein